MLQLRSVEAKLVSERPDDALSLRSAIELEGTYLKDGVPKTLKEDLQSRQAAAQKAPAATTGSDRPVHVFVDHSNILVGLISQLDPFSNNSTPLPPGSKARLSHLALSLILTRGRSPLTLALVGSSPLWQPLDQLEARGWDICLLQRVRAALDVGPSGASSAEEDSAGPSSHRRQRSVMKEQAVDEMLQLKMLLAIALHPPGTMVIATGDSAGSHLNPLGFAGIAELALVKGWDVELCAWASSIGRSWKDLARRWAGSTGLTATAGPRSGRMVIRPLDGFRDELEEI